MQSGLIVGASVPNGVAGVELLFVGTQRGGAFMAYDSLSDDDPPVRPPNPSSTFGRRNR